MRCISNIKCSATLIVLSACMVAQARSIAVLVGGPDGQYYVRLLKWTNNRQVVVREQTGYLTGYSLTGACRIFKFDNISEGVYCADINRVGTNKWMYTSSVWARWAWGNYNFNSVIFGYE